MSGDVVGFTLTFNPEAWEYFYETLSTFTDRGYMVDLNGRTVLLVRIEGPSIWDADAVLIVRPWDDKKNDASDDEERVALYNDGIPTVETLYLH
jgi:hypothetical protein